MGLYELFSSGRMVAFLRLEQFSNQVDLEGAGMTTERASLVSQQVTNFMNFQECIEHVMTHPLTLIVGPILNFYSWTYH